MGKWCFVKTRLSTLLAIACLGLLFILALAGAARGDYPSLRWEKIYNNIMVNGDDAAKAVAVDRVGDVYVTGRSEGYGTGSDIVTIKYSGYDGEELWVQRFNGPGGGEDYPTAMVLDPLGNVVVTGATYIREGDYDYVTISYTPRGEELDPLLLRAGRRV